MRKIAVITGASAGIGSATALTFAKNGYDVVLNYRKDEKYNITLNIAEKCREYEVNAVCIKADVSDFEQCRKLTGEIMEKFERIDVLINNAGMSRVAFLAGHDPELYKEVIYNTQFSVFNMMSLVSVIMKKQKSGRIVNISSLAGTHGSQGLTAYAAAKAGVEAMTRCAARELARSGIRVNAVCPGAVNTEAYAGNLSELHLKEIKRSIAVGHLAEPEEIAEFIVTICSDKFDSITGEVLNITGGMVL